jgi:hypothetical protein
VVLALELVPVLERLVPVLERLVPVLLVLRANSHST